MQEDITPDRIANAICQDDSFSGIYVLIEGDNDYVLFSKFFKSSNTHVQISHGRDNIIEAIKELNNRKNEKAIGIIDKDFDELDEELIEENNLYYTDDHDIEMMAINSDAFNVVLTHIADNKKVVAVESGRNCSLKKVVLDLCTPLGYLKWLNKKNSIGLLFKPKKIGQATLKIEDFIPPKTLIFAGNDSMVETVCNYSRGKVTLEGVSINETCKLLAEMQIEDIDQNNLCNGHDVCYIIALALRRVIGNYNSNAISVETVERELILSYDSRYFENTSLYKNLKIWETKNEQSILRF